MRDQTKATAIGLTAIFFWAAIVGLIRSVSEHLGPIGGAASIYTFGTVILMVTRGFPDLRRFPRIYLVWGALLFVAYELCLALSIGFAQDAAQTIEVGMVNYLWPTFTILAAVLFTQHRASLWIIPGFLLSMIGIFLVLQGDRAVDLQSMLRNLQHNPLSYTLALIGAFLWAAYSTITAKFAEQNDGVTFFFLLVAVTFWLYYFGTGRPEMQWSYAGLMHLVLAALAMGLGYAAWNIGILRGNVIVLAGASYFIPVLSAIFAALWLNAALSPRFWMGAVLVTLGSTLCWFSTQHPKDTPV